MALQFQPPPEGIIQAYLNRKQPAEIASEGIGNALQSYYNAKMQEQALASLDAQRKATEFKAVADYVPEAQIPAVAQQYGIKIPTQESSTPQPAQSSVPPNTVVDPATNQPMSSASASPATSPIIDHWNQTMTQGPTSAMAAPGGGGPPPRPTSKAGLEKYQKNLTMTKTESDLAPKMPVTREQLAARGTPFNPMTEMINEPPAPREGAESKLSDKQLADAQKAYNGDKNREKAEAVVDKVSQAVPLLKAGSVDNATAKQALQTAMTYMATGGMRVNEVELKQFGGANTVTNKMAQWYKGLNEGTLTPKDYKDMSGVLDIFQKSAQKNLQETGLRHTRQYLQRSRSGEREPDAYKRVTGLDYAQDEGSATGPHGASVIQNGHTYNWNPATKQYE